MDRSASRTAALLRPGERLVIAAFVAAAHAAGLLLLSANATLPHPVSSFIPQAFLILPETPDQPDAPDAVPLPELAPPVPASALELLQAIEFIDPEFGRQPGVIGALSAPQPLPPERDDLADYAALAGLLPGEAVTVELVIEVLADGTPGTISVYASSGNPDFDTAAIEYARHRRWIPGTSGRYPISMKIRFPVTLARPADPSTTRGVPPPSPRTLTAAEFLPVTRSHVIAWQKALLARNLAGATIRAKFTALSTSTALLSSNNLHRGTVQIVPR